MPIPPVRDSILRGPQQPELLREETLADLFEYTAAYQPDSVALIFEGRQLRYSELDSLADAAAHRLIDAYGVRPGMIVGLWMPRGIELLVLPARTGSGVG